MKKHLRTQNLPCTFAKMGVTDLREKIKGVPKLMAPWCRYFILIARSFNEWNFSTTWTWGSIKC